MGTGVANAKLEMDEDLKAVARRIQASLAEADDDMESLGRNAGKAWAEVDADGAELRRLERQAKRLGAFAAGAWYQTLGDDPAVALAKIVRPNEHPDDFWSEALTEDGLDRADEPAFVAGFAEAAVEVYLQATAVDLSDEANAEEADAVLAE